MQIRDELRSLIELDRRIDGKIQEIEDMRDTLKAVSYDKECVKGSGPTDLSGLIARIDDRNKEVEREIALLCNRKKKIQDLMDGLLTGDEWQVIHYRYFCKGYSWGSLERKLHRSKSALYKIHQKALDKLQNGSKRY